MSPRIRRGIRTIEVQAPLVAAIGVWLASFAHYVPPRYAVYVTMASSACIAVSRGLAKLGTPALNFDQPKVVVNEQAQVQTGPAPGTVVSPASG